MSRPSRQFHRLGLAAPLAIVLAVLATAAAAAQPGAAATTATASTIFRLCRLLQRITVTGKISSSYIVRNDNFGHQAECLTNRNKWANFTVASSGARATGNQAMAYPEIMLGCAWGVCTANSRLPRQVDRLGRPESTWYFSARAAGRWNASYDLWFSRQHHTSGQDKGAEIMIWLNTTFPPPAAHHATLVTVAGAKYWFEHWTARSTVSTASWNYILFRRFHPVSRVRHLAFKPFMQAAEHVGLLDRVWWLTSIDAGFEIWRDGKGLATSSYWAKV